ncbi:MAG TPA: hypothetical protein VLA15_10125 [Desulfurivibrionaceae bacterium]|nr:hypothetical protein [Desulfurivibrionaceae bacterium]
MRQTLMLTILALLFWGCSGGGEKSPSPSRSEQELLSSYLALHQKKDLPGTIDLFYRQDTPTYVIDSVKERVQKNFALTIASAKIEEIPPEKLGKVMAGFPFNGKTLVPNLKPLKQISLIFTTAGPPAEKRTAGGSIMFGKVDNICYFVLSKEKEAGAK